MPETPVARLLLVDDEPNVLNALRRSFRSEPYQVRVAADGREALGLMTRKAFDLVISDMRMPGMDGAQFLSAVFERWPQVVSILLTGHADLDASLAAVNHAHIYHYARKPWDNRELLRVVRNGLEKKRLEERQRQLNREVAQKNRQLGELNAELDRQVKAQSVELLHANEALQRANGELKHQYLDLVKILARIVESRPEMLVGDSRRVAEQARALAEQLGQDDKTIQETMIACLIFQVGKLSLPERLLSRPFYLLSPAERKTYMSHALEGQSLLHSAEALQPAGAIIRGQYERFDGSGFPDRRSGDNIPLGARILAVVRDYGQLLDGSLSGKPITVHEAQQQLLRHRGSRYDPTVVDAFLDQVGRVVQRNYRPTLKVLPMQLQPGMQIQVVRYREQVYFSNVTADAALIRRIQQIRNATGPELEVVVKARMATP